MSDSHRALRQRRARAAAALRDDARRAQLGWHDLAAWPDWAALEPRALEMLARRCGAWRQAGAWRRCIHGPLLQALQDAVGVDCVVRVLAGEPGAAATLPGADALPEALRTAGTEVLLATVPSPLLRVLLRERLAPQAPPPMPALDHAQAQRWLMEAQR
jgi:hypothetical protein